MTCFVEHLLIAAAEPNRNGQLGVGLPAEEEIKMCQKCEVLAAQWTCATCEKEQANQVTQTYVSFPCQSSPLIPLSDTASFDCDLATFCVLGRKFPTLSRNGSRLNLILMQLCASGNVQRVQADRASAEANAIARAQTDPESRQPPLLRQCQEIGCESW